MKSPQQNHQHNPLSSHCTLANDAAVIVSYFQRKPFPSKADMTSVTTITASCTTHRALGTTAHVQKTHFHELLRLFITYLHTRFRTYQSTLRPYQFLYIVKNEQVCTVCFALLLCFAPSHGGGGQQVAAALEEHPSFLTASWGQERQDESESQTGKTTTGFWFYWY